MGARAVRVCIATPDSDAFPGVVRVFEEGHHD